MRSDSASPAAGASTFCGLTEIFWKDDSVNPRLHIAAAIASVYARLRVFDNDSAVMVSSGGSSTSN